MSLCELNLSQFQLEVMYGAMRQHKEIKKERIFFYLRKPMVKREDLPPPVETEVRAVPSMRKICNSPHEPAFRVN